MKGGRSAWLVIAAALVPLALFAIFQIGFTAREQRRTLEQRALSAARHLTLAADVETTRYATVLDALATSQVLRRGDWEATGLRIEELARLNSDVRGVTIFDPATGAFVFTWGVEKGNAKVIADGRTASRPMFTGYVQAGSCLCLKFDRATRTNAGRLLVLSLLVDSSVFEQLLPPAGGEYAVSAFVGPRGRFIARSADHDKRFSEPGSTHLRAATRSRDDSGIYRGVTLEGIENYSAFARSDRTGWTAHVALGSFSIDDPSRKFLASLGGAAVLSVLLAGLLVAFAIRQMRQARAFAERMQQTQKLEALGQLTGGLAHDFNNLLTPVIGTLDQLQRREGLDERGRKLAAGALSSAQRAARLTQQLLAFSRRQKLAIGPVDVSRLIDGTANLIERTLGGRHLLQVTNDGLVQCVKSDATQLELALLNLAINARDASPEQQVIRLDVRAAGDFAEISVSDDGVGMDEATQRRAVEPFFTTKSTGQGTGLGLAQVFGVIEQSGGTVSIESSPGAGTTVTLRLPKCEATDAALLPASVAAESAAFRYQSGLRLLVVDDDADVRAMVARMLSEAGHRVDSVANGTSALAALAVEAFDLVVTDYLMPVMNGAELIEEARRVRPQTPFLVITGFSDTEVLRRACLDTQTLAKPFTAGELLAAVARAITPSAD